HPACAEDVLDHVQAFDDLGLALGEDLATLTGHEVGEVIDLALDDLSEVVEQLRPEDAAGPPPAGVGGPRGGDRLVGAGPAARRDASDTVRGSGRTAALEAGAIHRQPAAGDEVASGDAFGGACHDRTPSWLCVILPASQNPNNRRTPHRPAPPTM